MCGRYTLTKPAPWLLEILGGEPAGELLPRYNIAPGQEVPIVRASPAGACELALARWGLVPPWAQDPSLGTRAINARSETAAQKPAFRAALRRRRCLLPADGFYEWAREGGRKRPYFISLRDGAPFAFAGLWEAWSAPGGSALESCAILTTEANERLRAIHPRMPVILPRQAHGLWLDSTAEDPERLLPLLRPWPAEETAARPVSLRVNDVRNDDPACLAPPESPRQASLFGP